MKDSMQNENARHSFILMIFTLFSRLLGIVKARVITSAFGASLTADVINVAFYLPNNLRKIFAEGAMSTAFIPSLSESEEKSKRNKLLSLMISFQLILFSIIIIFFIFFGKQIFSFISSFNEEGTLLGATLLPYFMVFLAFISISNVLSSILQYEKKFLPYGIAPLFFSLSLIFIVYFYSETLGATSMAIGVVIGSFIQLLFTLYFALKLKYKITFSLLFKDKMFTKVLKLWGLVIFSSMATLASQQFSAYLSTTLETGSATAFSNAMIFFSTPYGIIFSGIATVSFPQLASFYAKKDDLGYKKSLTFSIQGMLYLFIPASISLMFLSTEAVAVVLQTGKFTFSDTLLTSSVLFHLLIGLSIIGISGLLQRAAIARGKAKLSVKITLFQALIDVILSLIFIKNGFGIISLPIANNISFSFSLIAYFTTLKDFLDFKVIFNTFIKVLLYNFPMTLALIFYSKFKSNWYINGSTLENFIHFAFLGLFCITITLIIYFLFNVPIVKFVKKQKN